MIDGKLKKFAEANGLKVDKGVVYGSLRGFAATLGYNGGGVQLVISTRFEAASKQDAFRAVVDQHNLSKEYRVQDMRFAPNGISVIILDSFNTMKRLEAFVDWFLPLLEQYGASKADTCIECGMPVENGTWILHDGVAACHVHSACADKIIREVEAGNEQRKTADTGSYGKGFLGAFLGMLVGAVLWAVIYALGYLASLAGFVTGWLANLLYDKLGGKQGKGKIAILIIVIILGVLLGTLAGIGLSLANEIINGDWGSVYTLADVPGLVLALMLVEPAFLLAVLKDAGLGLLFAALGVFGVLRNAGRQVADEKVTVLK